MVLTQWKIPFKNRIVPDPYNGFVVKWNIAADTGERRAVNLLKQAVLKAAVALFVFARIYIHDEKCCYRRNQHTTRLWRRWVMWESLGLTTMKRREKRRSGLTLHRLSQCLRNYRWQIDRRNLGGVTAHSSASAGSSYFRLSCGVVLGVCFLFIVAGSGKTQLLKSRRYSRLIVIEVRWERGLKVLTSPR